LSYQVAIVGGGLAGKALALALADTSIGSIIFEREKDFYSNDNRVFALSNGSLRILDHLKLLEELEEDSYPIEKIHISYAKKFGTSLIHASEENVDILGRSISVKKLNELLNEKIANSELIDIRYGDVELIKDQKQGERYQLKYHDSGQHFQFDPALIIACDGLNSSVRKTLGIKANEKDYQQIASIFHVSAKKEVQFTAFERFARDSAIAMIPNGKDHYTAVWVMNAKGFDQEKFRDSQYLQSAFNESFGKRLGPLKVKDNTSFFPLKRSISELSCKKNVLMIGSSAIHLHPIAGQGYNLILRDIAVVAELLGNQAKKNNLNLKQFLNEYDQWRHEDHQKVSTFTHGLGKLSSGSLPFVKEFFGLGLFFFDTLSEGKNLLSKHTMGLTGRMPKAMIR
jgi:2-octaprenyl-6-methoxyphenol hydroxylase